MRRLTAFAAAVLVLSPAPVLAAGAEASAWQAYEDPDRTFQIEFPSGWTTAIDPFRIHVATAPRESSNDPFQETIKIVSTDLASGNTLDAYYKNSLEVYKSIWKVQAASTGTVAGAKARRAVIDQRIGSLKTRLLKCFVVSQGRVFVITCASEPAAFDRHLPVFEAALSTFKILPRTP